MFRHILAVTLFLTWFFLQPEESNAQSDFEPRELAELARHSVIYLEISFLDPVNSNNSCTETKQGTGFAITTDGHVITSYHLLAIPSECRDFTSATVRGRIGYHLTGEWLPLRMTGRDSETDVAVLKFFERNEKFDAAPICVSGDLSPATELLAFGFPLGTGYSPQGATYSNPDGLKDRWIVSGNFEPGMSGGPVYDLQGRVVGIVQGGHPETNVLNQVIPIRAATSMIQTSGLSPKPCSGITEEEIRINQQQLHACIRRKIEPLLTRPFDTGEQGVRCPGGGCALQSGSCNKRDTTVIYNADSGFFIDRHQFNDLGSNDATTGQEQVVRDADGNINRLSIYLKCDPADRLGADGGWNKGSFTGTLRMTPARETTERARVQEECIAEQLSVE